MKGMENEYWPRCVDVLQLGGITTAGFSLSYYYYSRHYFSGLNARSAHKSCSLSLA